MPQNKIVIDKETLDNLYLEHGSLNKVAKILNVSSKTVERRMREFGLTWDSKIEYTCNHNYFSENGPAQAYWAGFLITDGWVQHRNYSYLIGLSLASKDKFHLEKFKLALVATNPIHDRIVKRKPNSILGGIKNIFYSSQIVVTSKQMFEDLAKYNVVPRKTYICSFPEWMIENQNCSHFIRGIIDGDGWLSIKNNTDPKIGLCGTSMLVTKVMEILNEKVFGEKLGTYQIKGKIAYAEWAGRKCIEKLLNYLYKDATQENWLDRKKEKAEFILNNLKPVVLGLNLQSEQLKELYVKHKTISGVAQELKCADDTVKKYMEIYEIDWNKTTSYDHNHNFFSQDNESSEQFYLAGLLLGCSSITNNHIIVNSTNKQVLQKLLDAGVTTSPINEYRDIFSLSFTSEQIIKDLKERFNIDTDKKIKYSIPEKILNHEYFKHFLKGKLEVRKNIVLGQKRLEITGPLEYLKQVRDILMKNCRIISEPSIYSRVNKNSHKITFCGQSVKLIYKYLFN